MVSAVPHLVSLVAGVDSTAHHAAGVQLDTRLGSRWCREVQEDAGRCREVQGVEANGVQEVEG